MSARYDGYLTYMYRSRIDNKRLFPTPDEAKAFDTDLAYSIIYETRLDVLHAAFERRDERLHLALKFLAEETDVSPAPEAERAA